MKKSYRLIVFFMLLLSGFLLSACNAKGLDVNVNPDGKSASVEFVGSVEAMGADQWTVAGQVLVVNAQTVIDGTFNIGDIVKVEATVTSGGVVTANKIEAAAQDQAVAPSPEPTCAPEDAASATPDPSASPDPNSASQVPCDSQGDKTNGLLQRAHNEMTGKVDSITSDEWVVGGISFTIDAQTEINDENILAGDVVKVHYVVNDDGSFTATEIEKAGNNQAHNSNKKDDNSTQISGDDKGKHNETETPEPKQNDGSGKDDHDNSGSDKP